MIHCLHLQGWRVSCHVNCIFHAGCLVGLLFHPRHQGNTLFWMVVVLGVTLQKTVFFTLASVRTSPNTLWSVLLTHMGLLFCLKVESHMPPKCEHLCQITQDNIPQGSSSYLGYVSVSL
jgi:hypothetical protein